ncbi:hypothetical protein EZS27_019574 [termite gut metagenome]|uniref:Phage abortive infection protein n=1 Tax=termite gut metagenome TaxID=433724 RepID=A0A5J4REW5_9ZZZZ
MLVFYFMNFHGKWATDSKDWGAFGSYLGAIIGLLAFLGVLHTIYLSEERHTEDSERSIFFQLIELHRTKFENVIYYDDKENKEFRGAEAFKRYTEKIDFYFILYIFYLHYEEVIVRQTLYFNSPSFIIKLIRKLKEMDGRENLIGDDNYGYIRRLKNYLKEKKIPIIDPTLEERKSVEDVSIAYYHSLMEKEMRDVADFFYKEYGHILGHYFRNMYYVMDTINDFSSGKDKYKKIFRAQISRYEIALGLFNAVSSKSSPMMIKYLREYEIFKDIHPDDVTWLKEIIKKDKQEKVIKEEVNKDYINPLLDQVRFD